MKPLNAKDPHKTALWNVSRWGVILMTVIHYFIAVFLSGVHGRNPATSGVPAILSFFIARWYIQKQIKNGKDFKFPFLYGVLVGFIILIMQIIAGELIAKLVA